MSQEPPKSPQLRKEKESGMRLRPRVSKLLIYDNLFILEASKKSNKMGVDSVRNYTFTDGKYYLLAIFDCAAVFGVSF